MKSKHNMNPPVAINISIIINNINIINMIKLILIDLTHEYKYPNINADLSIKYSIAYTNTDDSIIIAARTIEKNPNIISRIIRPVVVVGSSINLESFCDISFNILFIM